MRDCLSETGDPFRHNDAKLIEENQTSQAAKASGKRGTIY